MRCHVFLAAATLLMLTSCGGGQVSNERRVVRFGQFRCTQPGVDVRKETTMSTNVSASLGSVGGDSSSTTTEEGSTAASTADRFFALMKSLKDAKIETGQSLTRKHERIAKLAGRGSELEVITYKFCEAAGNGLISKANYQKFLEITLQAPPAPAGVPGL